MKFSGTLATVTVNNEAQDPESREQTYNRLTAPDFQRTGLLSNRLGRIPKEAVLERSPGQLVDFHGSPPTSSRRVFSSVQKTKQRWQEACMDKQEDSVDKQDDSDGAQM